MKLSRLLLLLLASTASAQTYYNQTAIPPPPYIVSTSSGASFAVATSNLYQIIRRSNSGIAMNDTLPSAVTAGTGWQVTIVNSDATATDTLTPSAGTIGGGSAFAITAGQTATIISDGANYQVFAGGCNSTCAAAVTTLTASGAITANGGITDTAGITANAGVTIGGGSLTVSGNRSAAFWGNTGLNIIEAAQTLTDTTSNGAPGAISINTFNPPTLTTPSNAVTYSAATLFNIQGCPIAGTNVTITTCRAFDITGQVTLRTGLVVTGGTVSFNNNAGAVTTFLGGGTTTGLVTVGGASGGVAITSNQNGFEKNTAFISTGTKFTATGTGACSTITTTLGGASAGSFLCTGTAGASTATITINGATGLTATTGWACTGGDATSGVAWSPSGAASTTTGTMSGAVATTSDRVVFTCTGY